MAPIPKRYRAKLTDDVIRNIWNRVCSGEFQHDIAADHGINPGRISEIKTGKRGNHVTGMPLA